MIEPERILIKLKTNNNEQIDTGRYFNQFDNNGSILKFRVFRDAESDLEIDYSTITSAYITLKFYDGTHNEPCECVVSQNEIEFTLCSSSLCNPGTVSGVLKLYGSDDQIITTSVFRFTVLQLLVADGDVSNIEKISIINELISETSQISKLIKDSEQIRVDSENLRIQGYNQCVIDELSRVNAEILRLSEFQTMKEDITDLSKIVRIMTYDIDHISTDGNTVIEDVLLKVPTGYSYTIDRLLLISNGDSIDISDERTVTIEILKDADVLSSIVYNSVNIFPIKCSSDIMTLSSNIINAENNLIVKITIVNQVVVPKCKLQINYILNKI